MDRPYFIVIADDHIMVRRGIRKIIEGNPELKVVGEAEDGLNLLDYLKNHSPPEMVILDISMPIMGGIEASRKIKEKYPEIKVLILTMHKDKEYMNQALAADSYLLKPEADTELFAAISAIKHGEIYICPIMRSFGSYDPFLPLYPRGIPPLPNQDVKLSVLRAYRQTQRRLAGCHTSCETVEKGLNSADFPPSNKSLPKDN